MSMTESTPITRNTPWSLSSDECLLESVSIRFKTSAKNGHPAVEAQMTIQYVDGKDTGGATTFVVRRSNIFLDGDAQVVGAAGQPLTEAIYNSLVVALETYLDNNV